MIPIRDDSRLPRFPLVTLLIIGTCAVVFYRQAAGSPEHAEALLARFALVPRLQQGIFEELLAALPAVSPRRLLDLVQPYLTSLFLHGGAEHLIGNVWFLYVFGHNVEARFGHLGFLAFYLVCGAASGVIHCLLTHAGPVVAAERHLFWVRAIRADQMPTIGASGAIAGVLGAYLVLFPRARILTWLPPIFLFVIPSIVFLGLWFLMQYIGLAGASAQFSNVAYGAHVGGFLTGMLLAVTAMAIRPERFAAAH